MPSLHTDSPAATAVVATRSLHREAKSQNDELLLAVEAIPGLLSHIWHTCSDLEELLRRGGLNLPANMMKNALRSIQDGALK